MKNESKKQVKKTDSSNEKLLLSDVMGSDFQVKKIDFSDQEVIKRIEECKKKQQECLDRKNVDWEKLSRTYITI